MDILCLMHTARSASIEIKDGGRFFATRTYKLYVNGTFVKETDTTITTLYGLEPDAKQLVEVYADNEKVG